MNAINDNDVIQMDVSLVELRHIRAGLYSLDKTAYIVARDCYEKLLSRIVNKIKEIEGE